MRGEEEREWEVIDVDVDVSMSWWAGKERGDVAGRGEKETLWESGWGECGCVIMLQNNLDNTKYNLKSYLGLIYSN